MRASTLFIGIVGLLIVLWETPWLLSTKPDGNVDYGWAQLGAWVGGLLFGAAGLKLVFWDNQRSDR
jgi:hypothetical protein